MKRLAMGALSAAIIVAGTVAAQAQWGTYYDGYGRYGYDNGYYGYGYSQPGVGVQVGPVGGFVSAPVAGVVSPRYETYGIYGTYGYNDGYRPGAPRAGTEESRVFHSQEILPQSPPSGGY